MSKLDDIIEVNYPYTNMDRLDTQFYSKQIKQQIFDLFMEIIDNYSDDIEKLYDKVNDL